MYRIDNIKVPPERELEKSDISKRAGIPDRDIISYKILKKSVDARKKGDIHLVYTVLAESKRKINFPEYEQDKYVFPSGKKPQKRPVIVGSGPCGLFAAFMLSKAGFSPILIERGADVETRKRAVCEFWKTGKLDKNTNVQFGEGGAGTFSDGKLTSGINDKRCRFVLETFREYGANEEITYAAKPHVGTDVLSEIVKNIRNAIIENGGEVRFLNKLTDIAAKDGKLTGVYIDSPGGEYFIDTDTVILAIGHSARDTYKMLKSHGTPMILKSFSVGVRIEHSQDMINESQYGDWKRFLPPADYKLSCHLPNGRSAYTFCMCPGGVVVASSSEDGTIVTNGMSYSKRDGKNGNSALLVGVTPEDFATGDVLSGMYFQEEIERKAFDLSGGCFAPCQYVGDFLGKKVTDKIEPTYRPGVKFCGIEKVFPGFVNETLKKALVIFDRRLSGFANGGAVMTAPETRSSAPLRILRNPESLMSDICGLYPAGEGAGYAGGIMSAAVDGIKAAEAVVLRRE